jgi:hypothetical protein
MLNPLSRPPQTAWSTPSTPSERGSLSQGTLQFNSPLQLDGRSRSRADDVSPASFHFPNPTSILPQETWDILMKPTTQCNSNTPTPDATTLFCQTNSTLCIPPFIITSPVPNHFSITTKAKLANNQTPPPFPSLLDSSTKP